MCEIEREREGVGVGVGACVRGREGEREREREKMKKQKKKQKEKDAPAAQPKCIVAIMPHPIQRLQLPTTLPQPSTEITRELCAIHR
jgi:hypothetical protein